jgi:murein DD-endopeptidase MepM/ murein hydrolase activator NlpD
MSRQPLIEVLSRHSGDFHQVVPFDPAKEKLLVFDFTKNNHEIFDELINNTQKFTNYVNEKLRNAGAKFGIGGYDENRELYSRSSVFDASQNEESRRLHLGIDIWGKPYTPVKSPLDGIIHSFAFNDDFGDYGATIILSHNLDGIPFHTLFGHLSLNSIKNLREGDNVQKGDVIGEFGIPMENGQWPPHLHFQVIDDMGSWRGDYPGVCKYSEREAYLANCPDPDLILGMAKYTSR